MQSPCSIKELYTFMEPSYNPDIDNICLEKALEEINMASHKLKASDKDQLTSHIKKLLRLKSNKSDDKILCEFVDFLDKKVKNEDFDHAKYLLHMVIDEHKVEIPHDIIGLAKWLFSKHKPTDMLREGLKKSITARV